MKESCKNIDLKRKREREKYSAHMKKKKRFSIDARFLLFRKKNIMSKEIRGWKDCIIIFIEFQTFLFL